MTDEDANAVVYSQLIRPSSMRSIYWRFFGFPADSNGQILTRHKIVCKLCNNPVAYNRNTTNLMVHLRNRHRGVIEAVRLQEPPSQRLTYVPQEAGNVNVRLDVSSSTVELPQEEQGEDEDDELEAEDDDLMVVAEQEDEGEDVENQLNKYVVWSSKEQLQMDDDNVVDEGEDHGDVHDDFDGDSNHSVKKGYTVEYVDNIDGAVVLAPVSIAINPVDSPAAIKSEAAPDSQQPLPDYDAMFAECETSTPFTTDPPPPPPPPPPPTPPTETAESHNTANVDELLQNVLIANMIPASDLINGEGFRAFCAALNPDYTLPNSEKVESDLEHRYAQRKEESMNHLKMLLHDANQQTYFSIGIDRWSTHNQRTYLTVYVFHVADGPPARLETTMLAIVRLQRANWPEIFAPLPLDRCTAAVLNFALGELPGLQSLLAQREIPTVHCLHDAIAEAARQCFETDDVQTIFRTITDEILPLLDDDTIVDELPPLHPQHWHTRFDYLHFVQIWLRQDDSVAPEVTQLIDGVLQLLEPLRVAQQTIVGERTACASLVHPIVQQLLQNHFARGAEDETTATVTTNSTLAKNIRAIVNNVFDELGLVFNRLSLVASTLDPRFQSLIDGGQDLPLVRQSLRRHCGSDHTTTTTTTATVAIKADSQTEKHHTSKLSSFLRPAASGSQPPRAPRRHRLDVELDAYVAEVDADLEQCPLAWWQTVGGDAFATLAGCARRNLCVPAVLPAGRRTAEQQMLVAEQRSGLMVNDQTVARMVWLQEDLEDQRNKQQ